MSLETDTVELMTTNQSQGLKIDDIKCGTPGGTPGGNFQTMLEGIDDALAFIHAKRIEGKAVLVHCDAGITRSASV
eukprot:gene20635-7579_t